MCPQLSRLLLFGCLVFCLMGCAVPDVAYRTAEFKDDLSGNYSIAMGYDLYNYSLLQDQYGTNPAYGLAQDIASNRGLGDYDYESFTDESYWWIVVTTEFANVNEFDALFVTTDLELDPTVYPYTLTGGDEALFRRQYIHEGTWIASSDSGFSETWSQVDSHYIARLPGTIVETNGEILQNGKVQWDLPFYSHTPYRLVTEVRRVSDLTLHHHIKVQEDLSGTYTLRFGFIPTEYTALQEYVGTNDPARALATTLAQRLGWQNYTSTVREDPGMTWVEISAPYTTLTDLQSLYTVSSTLPRTPASISLVQSEHTYRLTFSPITPFADEVNVRSIFTAELPGELVTTNGTEEPTGIVQWDGDSPIMELETKVNAIDPRVIMVGMAGATLVGGTILVMQWRNARRRVTAQEVPVLVDQGKPPESFDS